MRKLASIRKISEIRPIANADSIECAVVDGWNVVVKRGEFIAGDLAVYFEVDSWIPTELAPFLSKGQEPREYNGVRGERLRTVKLRGQLSQGLLLHLGVINIGWLNEYKVPGYDLTDIIGIQKYEPPVPAQLAGVVRGAWPSALPKTDEERIQNLVGDWDHLKTLAYEITEKLEGSSMSVGSIDRDFMVCSRNLNLARSETNTLWALAIRHDIENKMQTLGLDHLVFQGEVIGEGVQGNHYGIKGQEFYVFAVYDVARGRYLAPAERREITARMGLQHVPVLTESTALDTMTVESVLALADGNSKINTAKLREGLVFKALDDVNQTHWKAVSNQYLLKHG